MPKIAIFVLAAPEAPGGLGRVVNAMEATRECIEADDDIELIFDGSGTEWVPILHDEDHKYHDLYLAVRGALSVCDYCTTAHDVGETVDAAGIARRDEYEGHPSIRSLVADGYEVITF